MLLPLRPFPSFSNRIRQPQPLPNQIASDFSALIGKPDGQPSGYYRGFTSVRLTNEAIQSLLSSRVTGFLNDLTAAFPDYDSYPAPACAAIFDMAFNLGLEGLTGKFPHFCAAVKAQDWTTAAAQCQRAASGPAAITGPTPSSYRQHSQTNSRISPWCRHSRRQGKPTKVTHKFRFGK